MQALLSTHVNYLFILISELTGASIAEHSCKISVDSNKWTG